MEIQPKFLSFGKLAANRLFVIPRYQRAYSWTAKQRRELFEDLDVVDQKGKAYTHFMSTVVGLRRGDATELGTEEFHTIEVVDGQQRLTTLTILLKALSKALSDADTAEHKAKNEIQGLLVKEDDVSLFLLQTNHDTSHIFVNYLRDGGVPKFTSLKTSADRNLADAIEEAEKYVASWKARGALLALYSVLKNRLYFIFHEVEDEKLVYTVFEVLNSRGLDVVWFDKLKSLMMSAATENSSEPTAQTTLKELHSLWGDIYEAVGTSRTLSGEALRFCGTYRTAEEPSKVVSEEAAVDSLLESAGNKPSRLIGSSKLLLSAVEAENKLAALTRLNASTRIVQARLVAVAIMLKGLIPSEEAVCLDAWEKVTFKIFGLADRDSRSKVGDYVRLAWQISNKDLSVQQILERLRLLGSDFDIDAVISGLSDKDLYSDWAEELRYLLYRYEEKLAAEHGQNLNHSQWDKIWQQEPASSIEHIWPQSRAHQKLPRKPILVHRLGNLMMLPPGVNSSLQNKVPDDKAEKYQTSGLHDAISVSRTIQKSGWSLEAVQAREAKILAWAKEEWK